MTEENQRGSLKCRLGDQIDWPGTFRNFTAEQRARYHALLQPARDADMKLYGEPLDPEAERWLTEEFLPTQSGGRFYIAAALGNRELYEALRQAESEKLYG